MNADSPRGGWRAERMGPLRTFAPSSEARRLWREQGPPGRLPQKRLALWSLERPGVPCASQRPPNLLRKTGHRGEGQSTACTALLQGWSASGLNSPLLGLWAREGRGGDLLRTHHA